MTTSETPNPSVPAAAENPALERHRNAIRVLDRRAARAYGLGGAASLLVTGAVLAVGWWAAGLLLAVLLALTAGLVALWLARRAIRRHEHEVRRDALTFLRANGLDVRAVCDYYAVEGSYEFFVALFGDRSPRRSAAADEGPRGIAP